MHFYLHQGNELNRISSQVWPDNKTAFPDFFKESTKTWWTDEIRTFYENVKFDGLWIVFFKFQLF